MRTNKIIAGFLTSICLLSVNNFVFAARDANFPDPKKLQPMPSPDIKPDISRNVNSEGVPILDSYTQPQSDENIDSENPTNDQTEKDDGTAENSESESVSNREIAPPTSNLYVYVILILILIGLVIYIVKQTIEKN